MNKEENQEIKTSSIREEWRPAVYYYTDGRKIEFSNYEASNTGKIRRKKDKRLVTFGIDASGYYTCHMYSVGPEKRRYHPTVHRVIASTFIPTDDYSQTVNHIDGEQKLNNSITNLEWMSLQDNINAAYEEGLRSMPGVTPVDQIDKNTLQIIATYPSAREAERQTGITNQQIGMVCLGKKLTAGGYIWRHHQEEN